jgi:glycosyltransferase involved in cell wall biosynthesis
MTQISWVQSLFRSGSNTSRDVRLDFYWLLGLGLLLIATGIGLRDPWPADEPRFALIVRDMVATGEWLLPRVGGDVYADKPPLYFWLMGLALLATGSLRIAFLLPSLLSGLACLALIYDLGRRLWNRETGLAAALALLFTVQFAWQVRQAQIDATLLFWCVLSLYGLLRHLLLGPAWVWYAVGWAAAGFGVITKGVGFLPLLILIPFAVLRDQRWSPRTRAKARAALGIADDRFTVAVLGRVSDWKGQDVLARALAEPPLESIGAVGLVAGAPWPGAERPAAELEDLREKLALGDRLRVLGFRPDLAALLGAVDAVAVPSTRPDPFPNSALEAAGAGVPVVAAAHGGLPEMLRDGDTGVLVTPGDPTALASALRSLADDAARAKRIGDAAAKDVAARFTAERMLEAVQAHYDALLS